MFPALTEQERVAMKQSNDFFNFGSDGEELGGELEDTETGGGGGIDRARPGGEFEGYVKFRKFALPDFGIGDGSMS